MDKQVSVMDIRSFIDIHMCVYAVSLLISVIQLWIFTIWIMDSHNWLYPDFNFGHPYHNSIMDIDRRFVRSGLSRDHSHNMMVDLPARSRQHALRFWKAWRQTDRAFDRVTLSSRSCKHRWCHKKYYIYVHFLNNNTTINWYMYIQSFDTNTTIIDGMAILNGRMPHFITYCQIIDLNCLLFKI